MEIHRIPKLMYFVPKDNQVILTPETENIIHIDLLYVYITLHLHLLDF